MSKNSGSVISFGLAAFFLIFLAGWSWIFRISLSKKNLDNFGELPSFAMRSALTKTTVGKENLLGYIWVAGFIFTRCAGPCPMITANMSKLQDDLPAEIRLVTFTVDPDWDRPEILGQYARKFNADHSRWFFLLGGKKALFDLFYEGFKLPILDEPDKPAESRIIHSTKLVLVDKKGLVRGYYDGTDAFVTEKIKNDTLKLIKERDL